MPVNKPTAKRGCPKNDQTLERERIEALFNDRPVYIPQMIEGGNQWLEDFINSSEEVKRSILELYSPSLPHSLIYELESLDDESMHGFQQSILDRHFKRQREISDGKIAGAEQTKANAESRATEVWSKNIALAKRIESGNLTLNGASKIIEDQWTTKGDKLAKPTTRTISNWYRRLKT